jgi:hypothetical protein
MKKLFLITLSLIGLLFLFEEPSFSAAAQDAEGHTTPTNLFRIMHTNSDGKKINCFVIGTIHSLTFSDMAPCAQSRIKSICSKKETYVCREELPESDSEEEDSDADPKEAHSFFSRYTLDQYEDRLDLEPVSEWKKFYKEAVFPWTMKRFLPPVPLIEEQLVAVREKLTTMFINPLHPSYIRIILDSDYPDYHAGGREEMMDCQIAGLVPTERHIGLENREEVLGIEAPDDQLRDSDSFQKDMVSVKTSFSTGKTNPPTEEEITLFQEKARTQGTIALTFLAYNPLFSLEGDEEVDARNVLWNARIDTLLTDKNDLLITVGFFHLGRETGILTHFVEKYKAKIFQLFDDGSEKGREREIDPDLSFKRIDPKTPKKVVSIVQEEYGL